MSSLRNKISSFYGRGNNNTGGVYGSQVYNQQAYVAQPVVPMNGLVTEQQLAVQQQEFAQQTTTLQPIVQETIRQDRVVEVQPIIHREVEVPMVNHIERHITEPAPMSRAASIQHGAIIEERVHNRVVNEIQPVIHREIAVPQVEQVQQHYVERIVATPQHTREVVYEQIPAQMGQQFIQQGYGQQQFLQPGFVSRQALISSPAYTQGYYNTGGIGSSSFGHRTLGGNSLPLNQVGYQNQTGFIGGQQPFLGGQQPFLGGQQPFLGGQQQFIGGQQPFLGGQQQFIGGQQPFLGGQQQFIGGQQPLLSNQTQYGQQATFRGVNPPGLAQPIHTVGGNTLGAAPGTAPFVSAI